MINESAEIVRMQKILRQRQIENKRYEAELKAIEDSERRVRLAYERNRQEFLSLIKMKREKWWQFDENVRRDLAKKQFKDILTKLDAANLNDKQFQQQQQKPIIHHKKREKQRRVEFESSDDSSSLSSSSSSSSGSTPSSSSASSPIPELSDDDEEEDLAKTRTVQLLDQVKRSKSSVAKLSMPSATRRRESSSVGESKTLTSKLRPRTGSIQTTHIKQPKNTSTPMLQPSLVATRPKTSVALMTRRATSSSTLSIIRSPAPPKPPRAIKDRAREPQEVNGIKLALLIDRFLKNTPRSVERSMGGSEKCLQENESKMKQKISFERENTMKKDLRFFELVNCLSENKT